MCRSVPKNWHEIKTFSGEVIKMDDNTRAKPKWIL